MWLNEYQQKAGETAIFPEGDVGLVYLALKLNGEAGEVAEKIGKGIRDQLRPDNEALAKELGDVLWYVAMLSKHIGYDLDKIAELNINKLADRKARGKLQGSGDDR